MKLAADIDEHSCLDTFQLGRERCSEVYGGSELAGRWVPLLGSE